MRKLEPCLDESILNFNIFKLTNLLCVIHAVYIFVKESFPTLRSKIYSPKFSSKSFVLFLTCKTLVHLEFIFTYGSFRDSPLSYSTWKIILFSSSM